MNRRVTGLKPAARQRSVGEVFREGNLFRRRRDRADLYELEIVNGWLRLLPVLEPGPAVCFNDPYMVIERFEYVPWV